MTDTYAATFSAVVPVILLVAAVELHQITQKTRERSSALTSAFQEATALLTVRDTVASVQELQAISGQVSLIERNLGNHFTDITRLFYWIWALTAALLTWTLTVSLAWLADDTRGAEPFWPAFCLWTLIWGALVVINLPLVATIAQNRQEIKVAQIYANTMNQATERSPRHS
ncbi:hypothetical protein [Streptomyces sp. NPDC059788]|uniref:hypothetical protein n=1 Tax=Streptomyces sp. NPDC059788 TaxID=3346948 RepID=UPI003654F9D3